MDTLARRTPQSYGDAAGCKPSTSVPRVSDPFFRTCEGLGWDTISDYASPERAVLKAMVSGATADYGNATICGYSRKRVASGQTNSSKAVCSGQMSWSMARDFCNAAGGRLCSAAELHADETHGSGCNADFERVWSSTSCGAQTRSQNFQTVYGPTASADLPPVSATAHQSRSTASVVLQASWLWPGAAQTPAIAPSGRTTITASRPPTGRHTTRSVPSPRPRSSARPVSQMVPRTPATASTVGVAVNLRAGKPLASRSPTLRQPNWSSKWTARTEV